MAEVNKAASEPLSAAGSRSGTGFELRLERGGASVRLADRALAPGVLLEVLSLQIPDVRFPFDVGQGAAQFRHRLSDLAELSVAVTAPLLEAALARSGLAASGLLDVRVELRPGFAELAGRLAAGPAFTLKAGLLAHGEQGLRVVLHSPRLLGPVPFPAAALPLLAARALSADLGRAGLLEPLAPLLRQALAPRGWKLPRAAGVRLARVEIAPAALRLAWLPAAGEPPALPTDPDLLAAQEGASAFSAAEEAIAAGDYGGARDLLLGAGEAATAHPFAAERLLSLFVLEDRFHDEALDLSAEWLSRRPAFAPALSAEALVRLARGEERRAARALAELARTAAERGEAFTALAAAEAAFALPGAAREDAGQAVEVALALRRDHVPALRAMRSLAVAAGDREALLRADRRLVAYDPDLAQKARAHAELGELLRQADPAAARLHLDQALRLVPDDPAALGALARACAGAGEALRAMRALDRLRDVQLARGDRAAAAAAALEAGALWEGPLDHPENALLRYRAAAELQPSAETHGLAARAAERLGQWVEAADHHAAVLSSLDPTGPGAAEALARAHLSLAEVAEQRLANPAGAVAHLEAAATLQPGDAGLLRRLAALHRSLGRADGLAAALDRLAPLSPPAERGGLLAEAGEALLSLGQPDAARARFTAALANDSLCQQALDGLARLAAARGDVLGERDALSRLLPLARSSAEVAGLHDRLAAACDRAGDRSGAARAARAARAAAPTPERLQVELRLAREAGDPAQLAALLPEAAQAAAAGGELVRSAALLLEQARLLAPEAPSAALAALAEAHAAAPADAEVLRAQADLAERTGDLLLALGALRALLSGFPPDGPALELRAARAALSAGELGSAREHAARAEAASTPGAGEVLAEVLARTGDGPARAALLVRLGRLEEAAELLERAGRHLEAAPLLLRTGRLRAAAAAFERGGEPAQAASALAQAAEDPAAADEVLPQLAELRLALGDPPAAAAALLRLARLRGGREGAELAWRAQRLSPGVAALDVAADCDPGFAPARAARAAAREELDPAGALADAEAALSSPEPLPAEQRAAVLGLAARAAAVAGDAAGERRHLEAYAAAVPGDDAALGRLAELHRAAGDEPALAAALDRRIERAGGSEAAALRLERAALAVRGGDLAAAAAQLEEALRSDPSALAALRALTDPPVVAQLAEGRRADLLGLRAAHPGAAPAERAAALAERARLLAEAGQPAAALEALRAAAGHGPLEDASLELLATLAGAAGAAEEAAAALVERAGRARDRGEPGAGDRLAEAGLAALEAGHPGAQGALEASLGLGPGREAARAVHQALVVLARASGDAARERTLLAGLVPLLRTGERPAALLRHAALSRDAGDLPAARASAEEARTLAPRDPAAVEAARAAAQAEGDLPAVAARLAELAELLPADRGPRLLERARLLAPLDPAEADQAYSAASAALAPDRRLVEEHVRFRRQRLPGASAAEPLERHALRTEDRREAARALRAAAALALEAGDSPTALRCARRAFARSQDELSFAGPLLARVLYLGGSWAEALVLHRRLLEAGLERLPVEDALSVARQLAELAEDAGDPSLARTALEQVLSLRPSDLEAAQRRFALDPDRARAARELAAQADYSRSAAHRSEALAAAAEAALGEVGDAPLADTLYRRARDAARRLPARAAAVARRRVDAFRAAEGTRSQLVVEALEEAAEQALAAGDRAEARALLTEGSVRARERGQLARAGQLLTRLADLATADGDQATASRNAREAGELFAWAGMLPAAASVLRGAVTAEPADLETLALLESVARAQGPEGSALLSELLERRIALAGEGVERAGARVALADALLQAGNPEAEARAEVELRRALDDHPASAAAAGRLDALLAAGGRQAERARLMLARAAHEPDRAAAARLRREAADLLAACPGVEERALAAAAYGELSSADPSDLLAHRAAARLRLGMDEQEKAIPHLAALVRADPDDEQAAQELADAYSDRHRERAELYLQRAVAAQGERRAARLREAAKALFAAGEDARARSLLLQAFQAWPADDTAFVAALRDATTDVDRIDSVLSARARAVPSEAAACHRARADALLAFGEAERAAEAYQAALEAAPDDVAALAALAACLAAGGHDGEGRAVDARLLARAEAEPRAVPPSAEAGARYRRGLNAWAEGHPADAIADLERALALAPADERAGVAWAALAHGHAARGDGALALAAARSRVERAVALGLKEEWRAALEAGAEICEQHGDAGRDAAEILVCLLDLRGGEEPQQALEPLARRTARSLAQLGEDERARDALSRAGILEEEEASIPSLELVPAPPPEPQLRSAPELPAPPPEAAAEPVAEPADEPVAAEPVAETLAEAASGPGPAAEAVSEVPPPLVVEPPGEAAAPAGPADRARALAERALSTQDPGARCAAFLEYAAALGEARAPADELRTALALAAEADPESAEPWRARARLEDAEGDPVAGARAHLSVSIRSDGEEAARAALEAARQFGNAGLAAEATRAYRAAVHAQPRCAPALVALAEEAMAAGDAAAAASHLSKVDPGRLPAEERPAHHRRLANALEAAGRVPDAEGVWTAVFKTDPGDGEAFEQAARLAQARGAVDAWIELAQARDQALVRAGDAAGRTELRRGRARVLAAAGRLEAARAALQSALELSPGQAGAEADLAELDGRAEGWRRAAADLTTEVTEAADPAARAALHLRRARILTGPLADPAAGAVAAGEALVEARMSSAMAARRIAAEAEALLRLLGQPSGEPPVPVSLPADPVSSVLRAQAEVARSTERAELFERLAGHLERSGDREGAADALLAALETDPDRPLTYSWLRSLAFGDVVRLARADAIRAGDLPATPPSAPGPRITLRLGLPEEEQRATAPAAANAPEPPPEEPAPEPPPEAPAPEPGAALFSSEELVPMLEELEPGGPPPAGQPSALPPRDQGEPAGLDEALEGFPLLDAAALPSEPSWAVTPFVASPEEGPGPHLGVESLQPDHLLPELEEEGLALRGPPEPELPSDARALDAALGERRPSSAAFEAAGAVTAAEPANEPGSAAEPVPPAEIETEIDLGAEGVAEIEAAGSHLEAGVDRGQAPPAPPPAPAPTRQAELAGQGRVHLEAQEWELAYAELSEALDLAPGDAGLQRDLMRAAEKVGNHERYVELAELSIDALAAQDALGAAARLRHLADVLRVRLGQPERAAGLLERALRLVPGDPDTQRELAATQALRPRNAPRALEGWLAIARHDPSDAGALSALSSLCARTAEGAEPPLAARLGELGRLAASLASFASPGAPRPPASRLAARISPEARAEVASPPGSGPSARLLGLLAPWLEPLFPADLSRRGASSADWLAPPRAPGLRAAIEAASRALGARPHAAFLTGRPGVEVAVENTQPPAMIFSSGVADLSEGALRFLAARTLDQVQHGWALGGRFAPRDVGILLELACRFAGGTAPSLGLPAERAGSFLAALARSVPAGVVERAHQLAADSARELGGLEPRAFADGLRRTANRVALLYSGDPGEALRALAALDRPGESSALEPVQALALPDVADLAQLTLSDRFLELRLAVLG